MSLSDPRLCSWRSAQSKQRIHCRPCPDLVSWDVCTCACICSQARGLAEPSSLRPVHVTTLFPLYNWAKEKVGAPCAGSRTEPGTWEALGVPAACPMAQPHELPFPGVGWEVAAVSPSPWLCWPHAVMWWPRCHGLTWWLCPARGWRGQHAACSAWPCTAPGERQSHFGLQVANSCARALSQMGS